MNGTKQTSLKTTTYGSQDAQYAFNDDIIHYINKDGSSLGNNYSSYYIAEVNFIDGQALSADSFGETKSGVWIPKQYTGSYGSNGFHLEFKDNSDIGKDTSGNNPANDFTPVNLGTHDVVPDSPTLNYPTFQSTDLGAANLTLSQGSLKVANSSTTSSYNAISTMATPNSGKWYAEFGFPTRTGGTGHLLQIGVVEATASAVENGNLSLLGTAGTNASGLLMTDSSSTSDGYWVDASREDAFDAVVTTSTIISVAVDFDNGGFCQRWKQEQ